MGKLNSLVSIFSIVPLQSIWFIFLFPSLITSSHFHLHLHLHPRQPAIHPSVVHRIKSQKGKLNFPTLKRCNRFRLNPECANQKHLFAVTTSTGQPQLDKRTTALHHQLIRSAVQFQNFLLGLHGRRRVKDGELFETMGLVLSSGDDFPPAPAGRL